LWSPIERRRIADSTSTKVASDAVDYAMHRSRSHDAVIRVYDEAGNVIETHEHVGDLKGNVKVLLAGRSRFLIKTKQMTWNDRC